MLQAYTHWVGRRITSRGLRDLLSTSPYLQAWYKEKGAHFLSFSRALGHKRHAESTSFYSATSSPNGMPTER
eukprot:596240-Pelagomonas_calceolata.AAC.1